jgi:hypothetical protein
MGFQEGFHATAQLRIAPAFALQDRRALGRRLFSNGLKDALDALKIGRHVELLCMLLPNMRKRRGKLSKKV